MNACAVNVPGIVRTCEVSRPSSANRARYGASSSPTAAIITGSPPSSFMLYAMLPAQPPNSRRISSTRNETFSRCTLSGRM
jgi:hypothetical protein